MKAKRKIEVDVEPLGEARWAKIDARVFEALDDDAAAPAPASTPPARPRMARRWSVGVIGFAAVAAAAILVWRVALPPRDAFVHDPSHIETGTVGSRLALGYATLEVAPESAVTTSGDDAHGLLVVLEKGAVDCEVAPRAGRPPFVVAAGEVRVRVVGTRFVVRRDGERVGVDVRHGSVEVSRAGELVVLHDGETWPPAPPPPTAAPTTTTSATDTLTPAPSASATAARSAVATTRAPAQSDQQAYEQAARSEAKTPAEAMATYRRLAAGGGPWAAPSLFAAGRLAHDRGDTAAARALLRQYLDRYPNGPNADDARRLLDGVP
jgi:hypothetical protein